MIVRNNSINELIKIENNLRSYEQKIINLIMPYVKNDEIKESSIYKIFDYCSEEEIDNIKDIIESQDIRIVNQYNDEDEENFIDENSIIFEDYNSSDINNKTLNNNLLIYEATVNKNKEAMNLLIENNINLVKKYASIFKKCSNTTLDEDELIQEGLLGMIIAIEKFDLKRDCEFSTYAVCWIRQKIRRYIYDKGDNIRLPNHMHQAINSIRKFSMGYQIENGIEPTLEEIANFLDMSIDKVKRCVFWMKNTVSLDVPVTSDGDVSDTLLLEMIVDKKSITPEESLEKLMLHEHLDELLGKLTKKEEKVLRMRFGLDNSEQMTLEEIGKIFNVTRERIRQIEAKALRKLQLSKRCAKLKDYIR